MTFASVFVLSKAIWDLKNEIPIVLLIAVALIIIDCLYNDIHHGLNELVVIEQKLYDVI